MSVPSAHISWALEKKPGKEHVILQNFVKRFKYTNKDSANNDFLQLLGIPQLQNRRRTLLQNLHKHFVDNLEERFWLNHTLSASTKNTTKKTATAVQNVGAILAEKEYQGLADDLRGYSPSVFDEIEDDLKDYVSVEEEEEEDGDQISSEYIAICFLRLCT